MGKKEIFGCILGLICILCLNVCNFNNIIYVAIAAAAVIFVYRIVSMLDFDMYGITSKFFKRQTIERKELNEYNREILYLKNNNKINEFLENEHCKLLYNDYGNGYQIRIQDKHGRHKIINVQPFSSDKKYVDFVEKLWLIIQAYFSKDITFNGIKWWLDYVDKEIQVDIWDLNDDDKKIVITEEG